MNLARTPLLLERRSHAHKRKRKRKRRESPFEVTTRSMDIPPFMPRVGLAMAGPGSFGPIGVGGIMRHS